jgi:hypothetical protein
MHAPLHRRSFGSAGSFTGMPLSVAAGIFELDDTEGPVRERLLQMEGSWRALLAQHVAQAIELGHLRPDPGLRGDLLLGVPLLLPR